MSLKLHRVFVHTLILKSSGCRDMSMILQELHYSATRTSECSLKQGIEVPLELLYHGDVPGFEWCGVLLVDILYGLGHTRTQFCGFLDTPASNNECGELCRVFHRKLLLSHAQAAIQLVEQFKNEYAMTS